MNHSIFFPFNENSLQIATNLVKISKFWKKSKISTSSLQN